MDFSIVKEAGLSQREFAALCGVSRETANMWCRGKWKPHRLHNAHIQMHLDELKSAVQWGFLPLDRGVKGEAVRAKALAAVLEHTRAVATSAYL
jgi:transcriptional regulator with XRE-family HTH domain